MHTLVFILPPLGKKIDLRGIKEMIRKYVGIRMIEKESEEMPGMVLNGELSESDKDAICKLNEDCGFIFVQYENEDDVNRKNYLDFEI